MTCEGLGSPAFIDLINLQQNGPYSSSLATSASGSSTSVWSDASSQTSDDTSISAPLSDSDSCDSYTLSQARQIPPKQTSSSACNRITLANTWAKQQQQIQPQVEAPPELRQNSRRTSISLISRSGCPPPLTRQSERKVNFVDNLVDSSTQIVEAVWPTSSVICRSENGNSGVLPLRTFIQETLRRSRTSYSTLQVALYYLILIKPHVPNLDFTMEQPDDCHASRALQCGRRMFLAALILASKYLQDRNYSARAWSKISGLNTQEINQNEMAFVMAVNWKLHITDEVYTRWTDCVMKYTPSQPPSPGGCIPQREFDRQCDNFKRIILKLTPELDNLDEILPSSPSKPRARRQVLVSSAESLYAPTRDRTYTGNLAGLTPTQKSYPTPSIMEPTPASVYTPGRLAPALGLLPTPRLTPQTSGFSTPAACAASYMLGKTSSMSLAMGQLNSTSAAQCLDRWTAPTTSPQNPFATFARRSSLANTVSTASSPESMVSDSSRTSRSSSISSASSLAGAPSTKLDVLARCRYAKQCNERLGMRPTIASVPEDYEENRMTTSPESYTGTVGKDLCDMSIETPLAQQEYGVDDAAARDSANDAARALQELHNYQQDVVYPTPAYPASAPAKAGCKRNRTVSIDNCLQDNVREILAGRYPAGGATWNDTLVRPRSIAEQSEQVPIRATLRGGRKRVCCAAEVANAYTVSSLHPAMGGLSGPGMWEGILN